MGPGGYGRASRESRPVGPRRDRDFALQDLRLGASSIGGPQGPVGDRLLGRYYLIPKRLSLRYRVLLPTFSSRAAANLSPSTSSSARNKHFIS